MKKIHIESDIVLQSDKGTISVSSQEDQILLKFSDWDTVSSFMGSANRSFADLKKLLRSTKYLDQSISVEIEKKEAMRFHNGRITNWKFLPSFKLFRGWLRSR